MVAGYCQVDLKESDETKTDFAIPSATNAFQTTPSGLSNAPAILQRMKTRVLAGLLRHKCLLYLYDIIIHGQDLDMHLFNLEIFFSVFGTQV